jgi:hypothetical protein
LVKIYNLTVKHKTIINESRQKGNQEKYSFVKFNIIQFDIIGYLKMVAIVATAEGDQLSPKTWNL